MSASESNPAAGGESPARVDPGVGGTCKYCKAIVRNTQNPYGAKHDEPVCENFRESMKTLTLGTTALPDLSGWTVDIPKTLPDLPAHHRRPTVEEFVARGYSAENYEPAMSKWEDDIRRHMAAGNPYPEPPSEASPAEGGEASENPITEPSPPPIETVPPIDLPPGHVRVPNPADLPRP